MKYQREECFDAFTGKSVRIVEEKGCVFALYIDPFCRDGNCNDPKLFHDKTFDEVVCEVCHKGCQ